ncbi:MAG: hypothetical protein CMH41_03735 [Micrococcales bacterium]|nr:hypothetical protein [Micrococcales bacterium]
MAGCPCGVCMIGLPEERTSLLIGDPQVISVHQTMPLVAHDNPDELGQLPKVYLVSADVTKLNSDQLRAATRIACKEKGAMGGSREHQTSRSYRFPFALFAVHSDSVGIDIEFVDPYDPVFAESICTPAEWSKSQTRPETSLEVADVWSSKEALAKALGDAVKYDPRRLPSLALTPDSATGAWHTARIDVPFGYTGWVVWKHENA